MDKNKENNSTPISDSKGIHISNFLAPDEDEYNNTSDQQLEDSNNSQLEDSIRRNLNFNEEKTKHKIKPSEIDDYPNLKMENFGSVNFFYLYHCFRMFYIYFLMKFQKIV